MPYRENAEDEEPFIIIVITPIGIAKVNMGPNIQFRRLIMDMCERSGYNCDSVMLTFNDSFVSPDATPQSLNMSGRVTMKLVVH